MGDHGQSDPVGKVLTLEEVEQAMGRIIQATRLGAASLDELTAITALVSAASWCGITPQYFFDMIPPQHRREIVERMASQFPEALNILTSPPGGNDG